MTQEKYIESLKMILKQNEIERNLDQYKEVNRIAFDVGINGDPIKIIKPPLMPHLSFQIGRVYLPFRIENEAVFARANHYNDFGGAIFIIPHDHYVVLEKHDSN